LGSPPNKAWVSDITYVRFHEEAKGEIFNFIEMFYNPIKRHSHTGDVSPEKFKTMYFGKQ
tara:strand:+ start:2778 stop:2957 length:180 start_codon:yes stop_codon:yes gene_type:complete